MSIPHLSYSSITSFDRCPKSYQLSRVIGAQPLPAVYFALGTAVHEITEDMDRAEQSASSQSDENVCRYTAEDFRSVYFSEINKGLAKEPDMDKWLCGGSDGPRAAAELALETGPKCINNWRTFTSNDFKVTDIELDVTCRLPGMYLKTKGYVDRLGEHKMHGRIIVDIKTGKNKPKDKGKQLGTYAALLTASTGEVVTKGAYFMAQEGKLSKVYDLGEYTPESVGSANKAKLQEMNGSDYEAKVEFTCRFCDQQLNCFAYSGDTARTRYYDPLNPQFDLRNEVPF